MTDVQKAAERLVFVCEHTTDERLAQCIERHRTESPTDLAESIFREFIFPVSKAIQELLEALKTPTKP